MIALVGKKYEYRRRILGGIIMRVAVTWEMCGFVDIDAVSMEEAMQSFKKNSDHIKLPNDGVYVDGSFQLSSDDVEEMEAMAEII